MHLLLPFTGAQSSSGLTKRATLLQHGKSCAVIQCCLRTGAQLSGQAALRHAPAEALQLRTSLVSGSCAARLRVGRAGHDLGRGGGPTLAPLHRLQIGAADRCEAAMAMAVVC